MPCSDRLRSFLKSPNASSKSHKIASSWRTMLLLIIEFYKPNFEDWIIISNAKPCARSNWRKNYSGQILQLRKIGSRFRHSNGRSTPGKWRCDGHRKVVQNVLEKDLEKVIVKDLIQSEVVKGIAPKLLDIIDSLPSKTGVYYMHREEGIQSSILVKVKTSKNVLINILPELTNKCKKIQLEVLP
jgi:hypothetical protein